MVILPDWIRCSTIGTSANVTVKSRVSLLRSAAGDNMTVESTDRILHFSTRILTTWWWNHQTEFYVLRHEFRQHTIDILRKWEWVTSLKNSTFRIRYSDKVMVKSPDWILRSATSIPTTNWRLLDGDITWLNTTLCTRYLYSIVKMRSPNRIQRPEAGILIAGRWNHQTKYRVLQQLLWQLDGEITRPKYNVLRQLVWQQHGEITRRSYTSCNSFITII